MYRQFVNLIMLDQRSMLYSMRRLGIIPHLFHELPAAYSKDATAKKKGCLSTISSFNRLPRLDINFVLPPDLADVTLMHFFSLLRGQGEGCVMFTGPGVTTVYDVAMQSVIGMPQPNFSKPSDSIALSMPRRGDSPGAPCQDHFELYVMAREEGGSSFEVFNYCRAGPPTVRVRPWWSWNPLPSPPLVGRYLSYGIGSRMCPSAAAVVDETTICMSSIAGGSYAFNTVKCEWRQAGSWVLPFHGVAEYVPELGLWFGLETIGGNPRHSLCALDLSSWPPAVKHAWDYLDDALLEDLLPQERHLVNLGLGRFCIATTFHNRKDVKQKIITRGFSSDEEDVEVEYGEVTLLTGVEVVRRGSGGGLEMVKHKSQLYDVQGMTIHCVL